MPTIGLKTFSLSADEKSSFFAGESVIFSVSIADAAWIQVSIHASLSDLSVKSRHTCLEGVDWRADIVDAGCDVMVEGTGVRAKIQFVALK